MKILPWPNGARMAFAVRDDDVSFFTPPEKLEILYGAALRRGFKISFSVIPLHKATSDLNVPPSFRGRNDCYSVGENKALKDYLTKLMDQKLVNVVQHGYTHEGTSQLPEMSLYNENVGEILGKGKLLLEETFNTGVRVFVPPWESLSRNAWREISKAGMNLSMSSLKYLLSAPPSLSVLKEIVEASFFAVTRPGIFPTGVMDIKGVINISTSYNHAASRYEDNLSAERSFNAFERILEDLYARCGCLVIGNHNWQYFYDWEETITNDLLKIYLDKIFEVVDAKESVWKTGLNDIAEWIGLKKTVVLRDRGKEIEIHTPRGINGLTLRLSSREEIVETSLGTYRSETDSLGFRYIVLDMSAGEKMRIKKL